jgi:hypothetical protein
MANGLAPHKRGDTWNGMVITVKKSGIPVNLTGFSVLSCFRKNPNSESLFEFKTSDNTIIIPIGIDGKIQFVGRKIDVPAYRYVFDVQLTSPGGIVETIATSYWEITQDIS